MLLVGVVVWSWFGNTVSVSAASILREKDTISCIDIQKSVFPAIAIAEHMLRQIIVFSILLLFLSVMKGATSSWFYLPVLILEQGLLVAAVSFAVAGMVPFFPDLNFLVTISLRAAMFCSGVFFSVEMLPENIRGYFMLNPMANIIDQYRTVLLGSAAPHWPSVGLISGGSLMLIVVSLYLIRLNNQKYPRLVIQ
jgi:lipopolysaccharide transport system permease protein